MVNDRYAEVTKDNLSALLAQGIVLMLKLDDIRKNWRSVIQDCSKGTTLAFFKHLHDEDRVNKRSAMQQYVAQFGMLLNSANSRHIDSNIRKEALTSTRSGSIIPSSRSPSWAQMTSSSYSTTTGLVTPLHLPQSGTGFDVQSAVLECPSADGILRMLTHTSLMRNPCAPIHVPDVVLAALLPNYNITALEQE
ncbi:hypothetical protein IFR05_016905 [Cadophora sp. M221]|nr:hypothetical protein IFR05_016905 [Cadophora sp. M221]